MATAVWSPDLGDGSYEKPIIHADYSAPDVIREGQGFSMVASSFNSCPALPLLHSRDLVHWTIVNHVAAGAAEAIENYADFDYFKVEP